MSFVLRNAPPTFQRFINDVFFGLDFVFAYLDDILVASSTEDEHSEHLKLVFSRLEQYGLRINLGKSVMRVNQLEFLGYITPEALFSDASDYAVGSVLQQFEEDGWKPLAFFSKKLTNAQKEYSTYNRKLLGIYLTTKRLKHILEGR
ncbi:hypothetical protein AVEN_185720-1 [Araneus ventricosus]|uniref:Reverse transcriptase domain-containing protein n=1 Tax=Araneus ventricosus TaxID=182803 RepID=A0A4Y2UBM2_ARAVE|nr:hypothetical protein AVEN_185720-1 [Araneus ventricosus]